MHINSINSLNCARNCLVNNFQQNNNYSHSSYVSQDKFVRSNQTKSSECTFRGVPMRLSLPYSDTISAKEAWDLYEELALGNYLDIEQPSWDRPNHKDSYYSSIRKDNLSFLDKVTTTKGKKAFIKKYKEFTGFPDLAKVSEKIENEFCKSIEKMSKKLGLPKGTIIRAGYNSTCSVGKGTAFPGSDLDGAYVILEGLGSPDSDDYMVEKVKGYLWNATDQRILSYNHNSAFPQIYTLSQIKAMMENINRKTNEMNLHGDKTIMSSILTRIGFKTLMEKYREPILIYSTDYCAANEFFIELSKRFPNESYSAYNSIYNIPTKETLKNFGFFLDVFRNGTHFEKYTKNKPKVYPTYKDDILESEVSKLTNLLQIRALKRSQDIKPKIQKRKNLKEEFDTWDVDKQYEFIKTLIKASCGENERDKFPEYFANGPDYFGPLLRALGQKG